MSKTQSTTVKLSDTQLVILSAAAKRADGSLLPFPQSLTAKGAAMSKVVEILGKRKLIEEKQTGNGAPDGVVMRNAVLLVCSLPTAGFLPLVSMRRRRPNPPTWRQAYLASARGQPQSGATSLRRLQSLSPRGKPCLRRASRISCSKCFGGNPASRSRTSAPRPVGSRIPSEAS